MKKLFTRLVGVYILFTVVTLLVPTLNYAQYCTPAYANLCNSDDYINTFAFNSLTNLNTGCNGNANNYIYYSTVPTTSVQQGSSYGMGMQSGPLWAQGFGVWIDYNKDNDFGDAGEFVYASPTSDTALFTTNITVPSAATLGTTRLRVRCRYAALVVAGDTCASFSYGETEDYNITITAGTPCTNPPTAGAAFASDDSVCAGTSFNLLITGNSTGTGQTYQWQSSPNNSTWTNITGATGITYTTSQTAATYYRCMVTCGASVSSSSYLVNILPSSQCYCTAVHSVLCSPTDNIDTVLIVGTTLNNPATGCTSGTAQSYTLYPATGNTTATLTQGTAYTLSVTSTANSILSVWIDYNQNGTYESTEWQQVTTSSTANVASTTVITIPLSSLTGQTRMRIRSRASGNPNAATDACTTFGSGETEDYFITISSASACTNPPTAGTAVSSGTLVCTTDSFTLSLSGNSTGSGQTYQWQISTNNSTWTNITGATNTTYTTSQTAANYYRCQVTCGSTVASVSVYVNSQACYCTPTYSILCSSLDFIDDFAFNTLSKLNSGCNGNADNYIYDTSVTTTVDLGSTYNISMQAGSSYGQGFGVWIDYNKDLDFNDSGEFVFQSPTFGTNIFSGTVTIPANALTGVTRLRVRCSYNDTILASESCANFTYGETEDYNITIAVAPPCANPPTAGTVVSTANPVCPAVGFNLSLTGGTSGSGQTYQWQSSSNGSTFANIPGATMSFYNTMQNDTTFYRCVVTCGASVNSTVLQVNMNPFNQCYCDTLLHGTLCDTADNINGVQILTTTLNNTNTGCTSGNGQSYTIYPAAGNTTASLQQGSSYNLSVTSKANSIISLWLDYNQNGLYESTEWTQVTTSSIPDTASTVSFTVPVTALLGQTGMRVRSRAAGSSNGANDACTEFFSGETEDYTVTILSGVSCTNPPTAGNAITTDTLVCATDTFIVSLTGNSTGPGQTYQWQSSPNNSTWTSIPGATGTSYSTTQIAANYYRCMVTCSTAVASSSVFVNVQQCTCTPTYSNLCSSADFIDDFTFNTLSKLNSGCNGNPDNYIFDSTVTTTVVKGSTYNISMQSGSSWGQGFGVWIDYNKNGSFNDSGEFVYQSPTFGTNAFTGTVTIPVSALAGIARLRVRCSYNDTILASESCANFAYGETEDYNITISNPFPCTNPPTPGVAIANPGSVCPGGIVFLSLSGNSIGTGQTYQWQSSPNNVTYTNIPGAATDTFSVAVNSNTYYRCVITCGASVNSASVQVTMLNLVAGNATGPAIAIGNQVRTYNLSGSNGNIQWQSSADGVTFTDISGATSNPVNLLMPGTAVNDTVYIRAKITGPGCADVFSNVVTTIIECATTYNNGSSSGDFINLVQFGTISNSSTIDSMGGNVQDFKFTPAGTTNVCKGMSYMMTISTDSAWTQGKAAWIDFNNNGSYNDPGELILGPTTSSIGAVTDTVTIPLTAVSDTVKMRVICVYADTPDVNPCFIGPYAYGELEEYTVIINPTPDATITASGPLTFCQGGSLTLTTGTGGTYSWSNGATAQVITVTTAGTYAVTVTNPGNCTASDTVTVSVNPAPSATTTANNAACGGNNGSATVAASGGTTPYSYLWSNSATTVSITGLAAGTYFVTVTDGSGCTTTSSASVNNVGGPSVAVSSVNVGCYGTNTGSANAVATGGTTPYTYTWSNAQTTANATGLVAGTYTITVTDINNCIASSAITITQPSQLFVAPSTTNVSCNGGNNGTATANATGGTSPYTYLWSNNATSASLSGLTAGTYSVTITDSKSCTANASVIITEPSSFSASIATSTNVSCNGGSNGSASVTAGGGTGPYSYLWSGGQTTPSISNLDAGAVTVTVTDNNGCTANATTTITEPTAITLTATATNAACGQSNGSASVSASGGTGSLSFLWSNGQTNSTATGLATGTYTVTVSDANNCSDTASATVGSTGAPVIAITATDVSCAGGNDGSLTANATSGTTPYTYFWSDGQTSAAATGLSPGAYSVTVTGNDGCSATATDSISSPAGITAVTSSSDVSCNGDNDGTATVTASGGASPYTYLWTGGQATATATGLQAGIYAVTISDSNGCTDSSYSVTISQPPAIGLTTTVTNANCGSSNGNATATATGGVGGFTYTWSNGQTGATATGLVAGSYSVTAADSTGCTANANVTVNNAGAPLVTVSASNVFCTGGNNGSATANATGGVSPYTYSWSDGQATASAVGLTAGTYSVTVTDNNNCITINSATITEPDSLVLATSVVDAACGSSNGSATATVTGGVSPYQYAWSNGSTTATLSGLAAGAYSVTVSDANGCLQSAAANVSNAGAPTINVTSTNVTCAGGSDGSATVTANGGVSPYSYLWNDSATTASLSGLSAGTYSVTVTDAVNCQSVGNTTITAVNSTPTVSLGADTMLCIETDSTWMINAGNGFSSYLWSNNATTSSITVNTNGTYTVTVTDANGCTGTDSVMISFQVCIGINEINDLFNLTVFPNPSKGKFSANWTGKGTTHIAIYNILGEVIYSASTLNNNLIVDLKKHGSGVYMLQLKAGEKTITRRIVID